MGADFFPDPLLRERATGNTFGPEQSRSGQNEYSAVERMAPHGIQRTQQLPRVQPGREGSSVASLRCAQPCHAGRDRSLRLPIGLQVIGRNHDDAGVIEFAAAWERETRFIEKHLPPLIAP